MRPDYWRCGDWVAGGNGGEFLQPGSQASLCLGLHRWLRHGLLCAVLKLRAFAKYWLPVLAWMALIYVASGDPKSLYHSARVVEPLMPTDSQPHSLQPAVIFVRKVAHAAEYAVLALLLWRALRATSSQPPGWSWRLATNAWVWSVVYGFTDELHQVFVPTRRAEALDILIDAVGAAAGLFMLWIFGRWRKWWPPEKTPLDTKLPQESL